jgi:hypothetical protein
VSGQRRSMGCEPEREGLPTKTAEFSGTYHGKKMLFSIVRSSQGKYQEVECTVMLKSLESK